MAASMLGSQLRPSPRCIARRDAFSPRFTNTCASIMPRRLKVHAAFVEGQSITSQTVVVTGGKRGIGLALARQLLAKDNTVIVACRDPEDASSLQKLAAGAPEGKVIITKLDVTDPGSVQSWAKDLSSKVQHVDVCINNAGVIGRTGTRKWDLASVDADEMLYCFQANTLGPLLVTQQLMKYGLIGAPGSLVANMTSKVGSNDDNKSGGGYAYRASKAALNIVNTSMSIDLKPDGVTCVLLHPGWVKTDMTQGSGLIDTKTCAEGLISVMEGKAGPLNGNWYDYKLEPIKW
eukprot:CAMPEP_0114226462 /NCGR_PEP_ID=MMETSP0058-20121206/1249_1 /TAXON_ID=36894 /ORGANISM="Pyramimonas parkeae, CCMP726" /LENGTH=290 /DNA_ID=CAMNT_0001337197 /DNA_START=1 /DNA_END=870 /DNA_ORIENTATION=+